jgi:ABC-type transporter Mla subunit MlaD
MAEMIPTSEQLRREVLELKQLADSLRKQADELAKRSAELEKLVRRTNKAD